jgi:PilZ domain
MYDNSNLAIRCRSLWADVLCAVESRVWSINDFVQDPKTQLDCQMLDADSVLVQHPSVERTLIATLDLKKHAIVVQEFDHGQQSVGSELPFALLGDGNVYVTNGQSLMGDPTAVARQLMSILLCNCPAPVSKEQMSEFRSWASALMTARARRTPINLPIEIQTENSIFPASTIDLSSIGAKVQSQAKLDRGNYITVFRGTVGSFFRVVWAEKTDQGTRAGLVCLNPPLEWAESLVQ